MDLELKPVMWEDIETVWKIMIGWTLCFMKRTDIDRIGLAAKQTLK